ncbi:hypothetical protein SCUP515_12092 [Seiridium cupressi]
MPASEFAYVSGTSPVVQMKPTKASKQPDTTSRSAKVSPDFGYDSDDEIAAVKAENMATSSPKASILSKVKAKLSSDKSSKQAPSSSRTSSRSSTSKSQARADTIFAYKVLAETRI